MELTHKRKKCFERCFNDVDIKRRVNIEFVNFSNRIEILSSSTFNRDKMNVE